MDGWHLDTGLKSHCVPLACLQVVVWFEAVLGLENATTNETKQSVIQLPPLGRMRDKTQTMAHPEIKQLMFSKTLGLAAPRVPSLKKKKQ